MARFPKEYRVGIRDDEAAGTIFWYDYATKGQAMQVFRLLTDYGRDGIAVTVQDREPDGEWQTVAGVSFLAQPNHPRQQFQDGQRVVTPNDWSGVITRVEWSDGEWAYDVVRWNGSEWHRYAEHELTEAGR